MRYLAKSFVVDATQWRGGGMNDVRQLRKLTSGNALFFLNDDNELYLNTDDYGTNIKVNIGDYVVVTKYGVDVMSELEFNNEYELLNNDFSVKKRGLRMDKFTIDTLATAKDYPKQDIYQNILDSQLLEIKRQETIIDRCLREFAKPPIKGKVTAGKLKWRGIIMVQQGNEKWLEQRGKRISPNFKVVNLPEHRQHDDAINSNTVKREE